MKTLIYIPIVHNQADLGSLGSQLSSEGEKRYGETIWNNHLIQVEKSWNEIEIELSKQLFNISGHNIRIYQDGLPAAGETGIKIVKETAEKGSKNYKIIENLLKKGATLIIAENKELLLEEYYLLSDISKAETSEKMLIAYLRYQELSEELLTKRDIHIANRINETLNDGEFGIAFFGAIHSIRDKINEDIDIVVIQRFNDEVSSNLIKGSHSQSL